MTSEPRSLKVPQSSLLSNVVVGSAFKLPVVRAMAVDPLVTAQEGGFQPCRADRARILIETAWFAPFGFDMKEIAEENQIKAKKAVKQRGLAIPAEGIFSSSRFPLRQIFYEILISEDRNLDFSGAQDLTFLILLDTPTGVPADWSFFTGPG